MPSNTAAYTVREPKKHIEVRDAPYTKPGPKQVVIRNHGVAINPIDWMLPIFGAFGWLKWPFVMGYDSAGEVVETGSKVTRFRVGDRVVGLAVGSDEKINTSAQSSFQLYTVLLEDMTAPIPTSLSYERAAVLPLGLSTAACGLFQDDMLHLQLPSISPKNTGKTVLIWGGSTSVGSNAVQLAVAAGYEVFTTCSPRNFQYCTSLGAAKCFDYASPTVKADIIAAFNGKTLAGALTMGKGSADAALDILGHCNGDRVIAMASFPEPASPPKRFVTLQNTYCFVSWLAMANVKSRLRGIRWKLIMGTTLVHNGVGKSVWADYMGQALAEGKYQCKPDPMVVGSGLEKLQEAFDVQRKGVSAKKVVLTL